MPDDTINISCPGCNAIFELPVALGGEMGECTECGAIFEIPRIEALKSGQLQTTDTGAVKVGRAKPEAATNTVKLSRTSIGMVPEVKDAFQFGVVNKPATATHSRQGMEAEGFTPPSKKEIPAKKTFTTATKSRASFPKTPPKPKKKWWEFWKK